MKKIALILVLALFAISLSADEQEIIEALGEVGSYYYCAKYNSITQVSSKEGKICGSYEDGRIKLHI